MSYCPMSPEKKSCSESMYYGIKSSIFPTSPCSFSNARQDLPLKRYMREAIDKAISKNIFSKKNFPKNDLKKKFQKNFYKTDRKISQKFFSEFFSKIFKINFFNQKFFE